MSSTVVPADGSTVAPSSSSDGDGASVGSQVLSLVLRSVSSLEMVKACAAAIPIRATSRASQP